MFLKKFILFFLLLSTSLLSQTINVIDNKGTIKSIDNSKWTLSGNDIYNKNSGNIGIGTTFPSQILSLGGNVARTINMERHTTPNTAGNNLILLAGGATSGGTNRNGGNLILSSGTATGTGSSAIDFQTSTAGAAGSTDTSPSTKMTILGNGNVGIGTITPTAQLHTSGSILFEGLSGIGTRVVTADATGNLATAPLTNGTVTNVTGTTPISVANGTTTPVISLDDLGVTTLKLADNAVTSAKILDGTIANADLANMAALTIKGNGTNAAAVPTDIAAGTDGHILRRNGATLGFGTITSAGITDATIANIDLNTGVGGIYKGSGSLSGATTVTQGTNSLAFTSSTTTGTAISIQPTSLTRGTGLLINLGGAPLASPGIGLSIKSAMNNTTGKLLNISYTGANLSAAGRLLNISGDNIGTTSGSGILASISANAIAVSTAFAVTSTGSGLTSGRLMRITGDSQTMGTLATFSGNGLTSGTALAVSVGNALTTGGEALSVTTGSITAGSGLDITTGTLGTAGKALSISSNNNAANTEGVIKVVNTAASGTGIFAKFNANSTAGSGITILNNGNVGIGTASPTAQLHTTGSILFGGLSGVGTRVVTADASGNLATAVLTNGTVTNVTGTTPISVANGTTTPVISLDDLGVTTLKLADNAITTAKILDANVTLAKIAQEAATSGQVIKWNGTAWTPAADTDTNYTGSTSVALNGNSFEREALTGDVTAAANSNATTIANDAVTTAKILDANVTLAKIAQEAATSGQVIKWNGTAWTPAADTDTNYTGSTSVALNGNSFEREALTGDVTAAANSNATTIANDAITTAKILDTTISNDDLNTGVGGIYKGSGTTPASAVVVSVPTGGTLAFTPSGTQVANQFAIDGTTFSVDALNNRIGIGTVTPTQKLEVAGSIYVNAENSAITIDAGGASRLGFFKRSGSIPVIASSSAAPIIFGTWSNSSLLDFTGISPLPNFTERMRISSSGSGYVGIGLATTTGTAGPNPTQILSFGGQSARTINVERHTTANTAGNNLTVLAGGATSSATDKNGGSLLLSSGIATGTGSSVINFQTATSGTAGTGNNSPSTKMTILGNGNVGIGITNPTAKLHVLGNQLLQGNLSVTGNFLDTTGDTGALGDVLSSTGTGTDWVSLAAASSTEWSRTGNDSTNPSINFIGNTDAVDLRIRTSNLERISITSAGNVGIGTTTPNAPLQLSNSIINRKIVLYETVNNDHEFLGFGINLGALRYQTANSGDDHVFYSGINATSSLELMRIKGNGNVGIGTTPTQKLEVAGSIYINKDDTVFAIDAGSASRLGFVKQSGSLPVIASGSGSPILLGTWSVAGIVNAGSYTERMRISSSGNVGIGLATTTGTGGPNPTQILSFGGQSARTINVERHTTANTAGNNLTVLAGGATSSATDKNGGSLLLSSGIATGTGSSVINFQTATSGTAGTGNNSPSTKMTILGNGNVGIGTITPTNLLDVNGDTIRLRTSRTPASSSATCNAGEIVWDADFVYVCVATNTWKRSAISTW